MRCTRLAANTGCKKVVINRHLGTIAQLCRAISSQLRHDKWLTAFICLGQVFEFNRTPFGMKNAAQTFVRAVQLILKLLKEFADSYIDDSAVHSDIWRDHLIHIEEFLKTMRSKGLTLNLKKGSLRQTHHKILWWNHWFWHSKTRSREGHSHKRNEWTGNEKTAVRHFRLLLIFSEIHWSFCWKSQSSHWFDG